MLASVQAGEIARFEADSEDCTISGGPTGEIALRIVRPRGLPGPLPVVLYFHGGWVMGDKETHDRLVREIATGAQATVVFVDYARSPEAHYPVAVEQAYAATQWVAANGASMNVDPSRLALVGDSVGGNMVAAVTLLAKERGGPRIAFQVLFYPVVEYMSNSPSMRDYKNGPWLTAETMRWMFVLEGLDGTEGITAYPLRASLEQLTGLPDALVIVDDDILRDDGEAYAAKLAQAGVRVISVRYNQPVHDFVMLNPLANTPATRAAIQQAVTALKGALRS